MEEGNKDNFGEISEQAAEAPAYIKDFFDVDKASQERPDLRLAEMPAYSQFKEVFGAFSEILSELSARIDIKNTDLALLNDPNFKKTFYDKLTYIFSEKLEPLFEEIAIYINYFSLEEKFPEGWRDRMRYFATWPFLIHFGATRGGENEFDQKTKEETDIPLDYIRHPIDVLEDMIELIGLIDEPTLQLASNHDIEEDIYDGIFNLLKIPEKEIDAILPQILSAENNHQSPILQKENIPFSDLVHVMSKKKARGILRPRHTLNLSLDLTNLLHNPDIFMGYSRRCIPVKMADRLRNSKTSIWLKEKSPAAFSRMMDETLYNFVPLADGLGMVNAADWLRDFYELIDRRTWKPFFDFQKETSMKFDLRGEFIQFISKALEQKAPDENYKHGKDYVIKFRPRALRYRQKEIVRKHISIELADKLTVDDIIKLSQPFLNYVVFTPLIKDVGRRQKLIKAAQDVFKEEFPNNVDALYGFDRDTILGRMFNFTSDIGSSKKQSSQNQHTKFGSVVHKIFNSPAEMRKEFYGLMHAAFIDKNEDAKNKIIGLFKNIKPYVDNLASQLKLLDEAKDSVPQRVDTTRKEIEKTINGKTKSPIDQINEILQNIDAGTLRYLTRKTEEKILALFAETIKINFTIVFNGEEINLGEREVPKGSDINYALLHLFPSLLLYKNRYKIRTFIWPILRRQLEDGDSLNVYVGEPADADTQEQQIQKASKSLRDNVLSEIAYNYIGYRPRPHHANGKQ